MEKRRDLQTLRGLAILSITLGYLWPNLLPNGWLGNLTFVILAGHFTRKSLEKEENRESCWFRRAKRLLPTYYLILLMAILMGYVVVDRKDYKALLFLPMGTENFSLDGPYKHFYNLVIMSIIIALRPVINTITKGFNAKTFGHSAVNRLQRASPVNLQLLLLGLLGFIAALNWSFSLAGSLYCAVIALYIANKGDFYVPALTWLGDNSLSIYLVFWPLLRYSEYAMQADSYHVQTFLDKALLFFAAIQAGSLLEALSSILAKWIKSKRRLLIVATLLLSAITALQSSIYIIVSQEGLKFDGARLDHTNPLFMEYAASFYSRRAEPLNMTNLELKYLHNHMEIYVETALENCRGHNGQMPLVERMDYFCSEKGTGKLEVVVIGDSLAHDVFLGLSYQWKDTYSRISLIANKDGAPFQNSSRRLYLNGLLNWDRPIDVIVVQHSFNLQSDEYVSNMASDMTLFYSALRGIASKAILLGYPEKRSPADRPEISKVFNENRPYRTLNFPRVDHSKRNLGIQRMIERLDCPQCIRVDFTKAFCTHIDDECFSMLPNGLTIFRDRLHTTLIGSMLISREFIDAYSQKFE